MSKLSKYLFFLPLITLVIAFCGTIAMGAHVADVGVKAAKVEKKAQAIAKKNNEMSLELSKKVSLTQLSQVVKALGFVEKAKVTTISTPVLAKL